MVNSQWSIVILKAERVGFEPTVELPPLRFSRPACSTAPAPLRKLTADLPFYLRDGDLRITRQCKGFVNRHPSSRMVSLPSASRSEEHTSELQSHLNLVCRLLL